MLRKPFMLLSWVRIGRSIERGTLPRPAWCRTMSTPLHASRQVSWERISPSINRKSVLTEFLMCSRLAGDPVEKLSSATTSWPSFRSFSAQCEPMKPAAPVTSQVRLRSLIRACRFSYVSTSAPFSIEFLERLLVAIDHRLLREAAFHARPGVAPQALRRRRIGSLAEPLDHGARIG